MALTRLLLLVTCTGGALSCLTDTRCADMHKESMAALNGNDLAEYCRLKSKSIACSSSDTYSCENATASMAPMYAGYYNTCSLTADVVDACKSKSYTCASDLQSAMTHLQSQDITSYCSSMSPYLTCVKNSMKTCDSHVTTYDVLSGVLTTYDRFCGSSGAAKKTACQAIIYSAGCYNSLANISSALGTSDMTLYCSKLGEYMECFNQAFQGCDQSVTKESVLGEVSQSSQQLCPGTGGSTGTGDSGDPGQECKIKAYSCYPALMSALNNSYNPGAMCSGFKDYFTCVKEVMKGCDSSVELSAVVDKRMEDTYNMICGITATGHFCPGVATCMQTMVPPQNIQPSGGQDGQGGQGGQENKSPQSPNVIQDCSKLGTLMNCYDTELAACNYSSPRNYRFKDISTLFVKGCQTLGTNTDLMTCPQMSTCMNTYKFPTDITEITKLYFDPQFWCSLLKSTVACAEEANQCQADRSKFTAFLGEVNQLCPEAKILVTLSGTSGSAVNGVGLSTVFSIVMLLSIQL